MDNNNTTEEQYFTCNLCGFDKPESEYYDHEHSKTRCKECKQKYSREYARSISDGTRTKTRTHTNHGWGSNNKGIRKSISNAIRQFKKERKKETKIKLENEEIMNQIYDVFVELLKNGDIDITDVQLHDEDAVTSQYDDISLPSLINNKRHSDKTKRISGIRLTDEHNNMIEYLAKGQGKHRSKVIHELLNIAFVQFKKDFSRYYCNKTKNNLSEYKSPQQACFVFVPLLPLIYADIPKKQRELDAVMGIRRAKQNKRNRIWARENQENQYRINAARRAKMNDQNIPDDWPSVDDDEIRQMYKLAKVLSKAAGCQRKHIEHTKCNGSCAAFSVDHIVPIDVGGFHHQDNLRVISSQENRDKHTSMDEDLVAIPYCHYRETSYTI